MVFHTCSIDTRRQSRCHRTDTTLYCQNDGIQSSECLMRGCYVVHRKLYRGCCVSVDYTSQYTVRLTKRHSNPTTKHKSRWGRSPESGLEMMPKEEVEGDIESEENWPRACAVEEYPTSTYTLVQPWEYQQQPSGLRSTRQSCESCNEFW
jgi:hypothetical protein